MCDFIVDSAANSSCHSYVVQSDRIIFRAISEFVGSSLLIPSQNFIGFFKKMKFKPEAQTADFKGSHPSLAQPMQW